MSTQFIGMSSGDLVFQRIDNGIIQGFEVFHPCTLDDGSEVMTCTAWSHSVKLDSGIKYKSGDSQLVEMPIPDEHSGRYTCDTVTCEVCSAMHDADSYGNDRSWDIVNECEVVCMECRSVDNVLVEVNDPSDIFKSKNLNGLDLKGYVEIDTLFCDSSGCGSPGERAMTKDQAIDAARELIKGRDQVYAGLTGIGQFQVYVTLYRKRPARKSRKVA